MPIEPGDYIKAVFQNEASGESEWMWVKVESAHEKERIVFGTLDNEPLKLSMRSRPSLSKPPPISDRG